MALNPYRDLTAANGHEMIYALIEKLRLNGWTDTAWSNGTTRTAGAGPAAATDLNATSAWCLLTHGGTSRKVSFKRGADSNTWQYQYTDLSTLSAGNATTPDSHATYTKTVFSSAQLYPSSGSTNTKLHIVCSDSTASFALLARRTPLPGGSVGACTILFVDQVTPLTWNGNPEPVITNAVFSDANTASILTSGKGWYARGLGGEAWATAWALDNPGSIAGHATSDPSGTDTEFATRWSSTASTALLGESSLFRLLQPWRTPVVGLDGGGTLTRAAFGSVTVANDGVALTS